MDEFPFKVTISIPSRVDVRYGSFSTAHGLVSSIRLPKDEVSIIDRARQITGFDLSRGGFIRIAAYRVALEICKHNEAYLRGEQTND